MMAMADSSIGEEWTWNIVIETMKKLTIEKHPIKETKESGENMTKIKQKEKRRGAGSRVPFYPHQFPPQARTDARKPFNVMKMKKPETQETVPPRDLASSSLFKNFDPFELEEERKRKSQRYRYKYNSFSQTRSQMVSSSSLSWSWRETRTGHTRVHQMSQAGGGEGRAGGGRKCWK